MRHELEAQGEERSAIVDYSISPFTTESGDKTSLLIAGRDVTQTKHFEGVSPLVPLEPSRHTLLVTYARERDEAMSHSTIEAFLALDIVRFGRETTLSDWINTDALDGMAWRSERPVTLATRIWAFTVVLSDGEVRIYADG